MIGWANKSTILARYVIYRPTSRAYATMSVSVCLSATEVHWQTRSACGRIVVAVHARTVSYTHLTLPTIYSV